MCIIWCPSPKHIILSQAGQSWTFSFANFKSSGFPFWNIVKEFLFKYQQINLISEDRLMESLDLFFFSFIWPDRWSVSLSSSFHWHNVLIQEWGLLWDHNCIWNGNISQQPSGNGLEWLLLSTSFKLLVQRRIVECIFRKVFRCFVLSFAC